MNAISGPVKGSAGILLFHGRGLISALIRWQTRGRYSHAALLLPDGRIVEAWSGDGVRVKRLTDWSGVDCYMIPGMTAAQWDDAIAFALDQLGKGYDYWAIVRFISRERMPDNDRWFCSELVFAAIEHAGVRLFERTHSWSISPGTLEISPLLSPSK